MVKSELPVYGTSTESRHTSARQFRYRQTHKMKDFSSIWSMKYILLICSLCLVVYTIAMLNMMSTCNIESTTTDIQMKADAQFILKAKRGFIVPMFDGMLPIGVSRWSSNCVASVTENLFKCITALVKSMPCPLNLSFAPITESNLLMYVLNMLMQVISRLTKQKIFATFSSNLWRSFTRNWTKQLF